MVNPIIMESKKASAWPQLHGAENKHLREQLSDFCQQTSFTVLVNIYRASNILKKLAWCITFLVCLGWLSFQCSYLLERYFSYPFDVTMNVETVTELEFPSVTVCNMNPVKSSILMEGPLKTLSKFSKDNFKEDNMLYTEALNFFGGSVNIGKRPGPSHDKKDDQEEENKSGPGQAPPGPTTVNSGPAGTPSPTTQQGPTTENPGPTSSPTPGVTSTSAPGQTTTAAQGPTTTGGPGPTSSPTPGVTSTSTPGQTTTAPQGPTTTGGPGPTATSGSGSTFTPTPGSTNTTGPDQTPNTSVTAQSTNTDTFSTTEDPFGYQPTSTIPWQMYSSSTENYYESMSDYFMQKSFNQWDMLENSNVTEFYSTRDSELDAALMYAQFSAQVSEDEVLKTGHLLRDFMISCKFAGYPCSPHNFTAFHNHKYGNCYTFNHPERKKSEKTRFAGPLYGLTLELYLEQGEYVPALSQEAGVRVVIHSRNITPFPEDEGVSVAPGYATSIGLQAVDNIRLGPPHSDCANIGTTDDLYQLNSAYDYSKISCMKSCYQKLIINECGCEAPFYYVKNRDAVCNMTNEEAAWCVLNIESIRQRDYKGCNAKCPQACSERKYDKSISAAEWPSDNYKDQLTSRFQTSRSDFMGSFSLGSDQLKNFVKLRVYYQEMVYKSIKATKSYESMNLISDIGGQLGLWLGLSAITIGELCSCILLLVRCLSSKMCSSKTTPVEKVKLDQVS